MRYETEKTSKGNIGVSWVSAEAAKAQAEEMDGNDCWNCTNCSRCSGCSGCSDCSRCSGCSGCSDCSRCSGCSGCSRCSRCSDCSGCSRCSDCSGCSRCSRCSGCSGCSDCSGCSGFVDGKPASTPEQSVENLDKVRAIILDDAARLEMGHWHQNCDWTDRTCAEETLCSTTHCLAGWLQVCSTDLTIRAAEAQIAGAMAAPVAAKMFFRGSDEVIAWLEGREYVKELGITEAAPT